MFFADSCTPLKKLPPPTTTPIWIFSLLAAVISEAILSITFGSIPKLVSGLEKDSPESFSRTLLIIKYQPQFSKIS